VGVVDEAALGIPRILQRRRRGGRRRGTSSDIPEPKLIMMGSGQQPTIHPNYNIMKTTTPRESKSFGRLKKWGGGERERIEANN